MRCPASRASDTVFLGDNRSILPHAHYGYLMACVGQIDLMSKCQWAAGADNDAPRPARFSATGPVVRDVLPDNTRLRCLALDATTQNRASARPAALSSSL